MGRDLIWDPDEAPEPEPAKTYRPKVVYTVAAGDTLTSIADRFGLTWQAIFDLNAWRVGNDPNLITPGMTLELPVRDEVLDLIRRGAFRASTVTDKRPNMLADAGFVDIGRTQDGAPWVVTAVGGGAGRGGGSFATGGAGGSGGAGGRGGLTADFVTFDEVGKAMAQVPAVGGLIASSIQFRPQADELTAERERQRKKLIAELEALKREAEAKKREDRESAEILRAALFQQRPTQAAMFQKLTVDPEPLARLQRSIGSALEAMKALTGPMTVDPNPLLPDPPPSPSGPPVMPEPPKPSTKTPFWAHPLNLKGKKR